MIVFQEERIDIESAYDVIRVFKPANYRKCIAFLKIFSLIMKATHHMAEQSKLTRSHLCGLKLNESALSMPFMW